MRKSRKRISVIGVIGLILLALLLADGFYALYRYLDHIGGRNASPSIQVAAPLPDAVLPKDQTYVVTAAATKRGAQVESFRLYIDGFLAGSQIGPMDSLVGNWSWLPTVSGNHDLVLLAVDTRGNQNTASLRVVVDGDYDRDGDSVVDTEDACPDEPGSALAAGCVSSEDADMDGVADSTDACPERAGTVAASGCPETETPDRDLDGVLDEDDRCPDMPGLPEYAGCPASSWVADRDGDGVPDFLDAAPEEAGTVAAGGSPLVTSTDRDGDGVPDGEDGCPDEPGPGSGCPVAEDRDGDGVADAEDSCPDLAGVPALDGCMPDEGLLDTDGDGVPDFIDLDVSIPGLIGGLGLPLIEDSDGDGVLNLLDNCPDEAGPESNAGCPFVHLDYGALLASTTVFPELLDICLIYPDSCDPDGDGVLGAADRCPHEAGNPDSGCPPTPGVMVTTGYPGDRDMDGVMDGVDDCPDQAGEPVNAGCPDPQDPDRDGVVTAYDECPDTAGPVANNGCPRASRPLTVELKIVSLITDPGWDYGVYCYAITTGMESFFRVPEGSMMHVGPDGLVDLGSRNRIGISTQEDGITTMKVACWGQRWVISEYSHYLGAIDRSPGFEQWDSQLRTVRGEGSGGWFELTYRLCQGSCP
ncbi:MAG TPA: thrombospondin type 3 repeat-containing protein [Anaerolineaceae bacterium]|nr:thrombospondin type 3 repeat-containing protein [Anaerolineaceae bacterium]